MEEFELFSRGKSKKDNVWIYGDSVHWWGKQKTKPDICIYNNIGRFDIIQKTIGDFIGLRDKNNKPIFEDDVVLYNRKEKAVVAYQPSEYVLIFKSHEYPQCGLLTKDNQDKIEVISNVFDNKELLGDEKMNLIDPESVIVICAIRYALGRQTYMPELVIQEIGSILKEIPDKALAVIQEDVSEYLKRDNSNSFNDILDTWYQFLGRIIGETQRRKNH